MSVDINHKNDRLTPVYTSIARGACGIGFVASTNRQASQEILQMGLLGLSNLQHRGGLDADHKTGDGAGILTPIPKSFFTRELKRLTDKTISGNRLAIGVFFLRPASENVAKKIIEDTLINQGIRLETWRRPPIKLDVLGPQARARIPLIHQIILSRPKNVSPNQFEQKLYLARKAIEKEFAKNNCPDYVVCLSGYTIVYKGLIHGPQLNKFYCDLSEKTFAVSSVVFHQRYSTNTTPSWERAQPLRLLCHNGEINTIQGNIAWVQARTPLMKSDTNVNPKSVSPIIDLKGSDSGMLDNYVELLHHSGRDLRHVLAMTIPIAWEHRSDLPPKVRDFYSYHSNIQEPWDGPAAVVFSNGNLVGATLDRNGLRPLRYAESHSGIIYASSEIGAIPISGKELKYIGKLGPGQMIAIDVSTGNVQLDSQIKSNLAAAKPYGKWTSPGSSAIDKTLQKTKELYDESPYHVDKKWLVSFGYTRDDIIYSIRPMATNAEEATGSMGDDTPPAVMSEKPRSLFNYFRQRFAEVTNPPIDPLREKSVMSLRVLLGSLGNILQEYVEQDHLIELMSPILTVEKLCDLKQNKLASHTLSTLWDISLGPDGLESALSSLQRDAADAVASGCQLLILSDRGTSNKHTLIPSLLALSAVHHHLLLMGLRAKVSLIVDSGEPRSIHDCAALISYGASAICPYLVLSSLPILLKEDANNIQAELNLVTALEKGLLKIMSKIGISTIDSYCGAQTFECIGLANEVVEKYFCGTPSSLGGATLKDIARISLVWHALAYGNKSTLSAPGYYKYKRRGELHGFAPKTVKLLHSAVHTDDILNGNFASGYKKFSEFTQYVSEQPPIHIRDLLAIKPLPYAPLSLSEIESREHIIKRFSVAAMSLGSISSEVHETLAVAMNKLGAHSNSGEGGELPSRYYDNRNSRIKQIASGRFGVTPAYIMSADELQIKIAQGAKPGEGGQLPAHKVTAEISTIRHARVGTLLISPPPHHDIYSIEDLAQLIFDLRQINPQATISVKLVSQAGIGTIASGVVKAGADKIVLSGHSGGTGAAAWSSIKHVGMPWEIGLSDIQRKLINANLRGRVRVAVDGGLYTGRDVLIAALLGADEYSFGTSALIAAGCVMARTCHTNNCPVGIATQRQDLRAKFAGTPEQIMGYMHFVAEDLREHMATLGISRVQEGIGRHRFLYHNIENTNGEPSLDLSKVLLSPAGGVGKHRRYENVINPTKQIDHLNTTLLNAAADILESPTSDPLSMQYEITNRNRAFGATLSGAIISRHGSNGLPEGSIKVSCHGNAGQSFGAFGAPGVELKLYGSANDYVGKGLGGARIIIRSEIGYQGMHPTLAGNTILYGATSGELFLAGSAGERFAVRNSGAFAIVEGIGDHGCEYMTDGTVIVLGTVGQNFGAGMTGGKAYVYDPHTKLSTRINPEQVTIKSLHKEEEEELFKWVNHHSRLTNSHVASQLCKNWPSVRHAIVKVVPWNNVPPQSIRKQTPKQEKHSSRLRLSE